MGDEREVEMLRQVLVVPKEWLFVNPRNVILRTEGLVDSMFLAEFRAGVGNGLGAIPTGIGNGGKLHRLTSMSIAEHILLSLFHQTTSISLTT